jgi:hypothetical protein
MLDLAKVVASDTSVEKFKRQVCFKHVFLVGASQQVLDSKTMSNFLLTMVEHQMNPVNLFIVKNSLTHAEITAQGFSHLCTKKLPQFPNIIVKASDLAPNSQKKSKTKFKVLLC